MVDLFFLKETLNGEIDCPELLVAIPFRAHRLRPRLVAQPFLPCHFKRKTLA